jgi:hypothetical protein
MVPFADAHQHLVDGSKNFYVNGAGNGPMSRGEKREVSTTPLSKSHVFICLDSNFLLSRCRYPCKTMRKTSLSLLHNMAVMGTVVCSTYLLVFIEILICTTDSICNKSVLQC